MRAALLAVAVVLLGLVLLLALQASPAHAMERCEKVDAHHIKARDIRAFGGASCQHARVVLHQYFLLVASRERYGSCAKDRFTIGCAVTRYDCTTKRTDRGLMGRCFTRTRTKAIRFLEYDHLPER